MIACTHPGKIGDAIYALPTIKKLSELYNEPVDFYTSDHCSGLKNFIEYQPYINKFHISPGYVIKRMDCGIQPWEMPVSGEYSKVFHLGFRSIPDRPLHRFIANQVKIEVDSIVYHIPELKTLDVPYLTICSHGDVRYTPLYRELAKKSPIPIVSIGSKFEYFEGALDKTGLDFLDTAVWIANSCGFIGAGATYVIAEGFPIKKVLPHDGMSFDLNHTIPEDIYHSYIKNPTTDIFLQEFGLMKTLSKTLNPEDYKFIKDHTKHLMNLIDHFKATGVQDYRFEHEHRKWEYSIAYKAIDSMKTKPKDILE